MLSRELGGIQQCFLDYTEALTTSGHEVQEVVSKNAAIIPKLSSQNHLEVNNWGALDPYSIYQLWRIISQYKPNVIIAHGKAMRLSLQTRNIFRFKIPIIGVAHNYKPKWLKRCDYVFSITNHLKQYLIDHTISGEKIYLIPNMIHIADTQASYSPPSKAPIISTLARFVPEKGVHILLQALKILKDQNLQFRAIIGGEGPEKDSLLQLTKKLGLKEHIKFCGWVKDKPDFFANTDIFCVPSTHEPFGIVVLEGMLYKKPVICAASEGPSEIITDGHDGLLCSTDSAEDMASSLASVIQNHKLQQGLVDQATQTLMNKYDIAVGAQNLDNALVQIMENYERL